MPVLVELFYAPVGATILMEQPELHLHPSAQAALADVMISAIKAREDAKQRNIQLIIETHSEHFLRRFQRRIAEGSIDSSQVCGYFVNTTNVPVTLEALQIDLFGNIINWLKHSIYYDHLPDYFIAFDVFDTKEQKFFSVQRRNALLKKTNVAIVPKIGYGRFDLDYLLAMEFTSSYGDETSEGIYLRRDSEKWLECRAKIVRANFSQSIGVHWSKKLWN